MILKKFVPLVLIALCFFSTLRSQVRTNESVLRAASLNADKKYREMYSRLEILARQKNWPLFINQRKGGKTFLVGVDRNGMPVYVSTFDNIISAATIGTNQLWPGGSTGLNLNGSTAALKGKIAIWDGGKVRLTHQELTGRVVQKDNSPDLLDHATHVSGTMIATGVNPVAKGMAFGAQQLLAYDFNNDVTEMFGEAPNLLVSNHSYGLTTGWSFDATKNQWDWYGRSGDTADVNFGYYNDYAQDFDSISYFAPFYLISVATGNARGSTGPAVGQPYFGLDFSGNLVAKGNRPANISSNDMFNVIPPPATAKNNISIGAVNPLPGGYSTPASVELAFFSSWGPTKDGRIKPDLVTDGVDVLSCVATSDNAYAIFQGTSQATPAATGSGFLLQEYYYRLHSSFMRSATLKGILIHTADEAGIADGPDFQYGWGLVDIPKAASVITSNNSDQLIQENTLTNAAGTYSFSFVASGKGPVKATICWTDPPGDVNESAPLNDPTPKLVNDLDLRITSNGTTYTPWVLNPLIPWNPATHGDDNLNNVEKIEIPNSVPGKTYTITVTHKGTLKYDSQAYSLIVSGAGNSPYCVSTATSPAGTRIDQVNISNLNFTNPAGCTTYTDNSSHTINLQSNQTVPFSIKLSSCDATTASRVVKVFIDYNNNGSFTDSGETVAVSPVLAGGAVTYSGNLDIPAGINAGNNTLMRIVAEETTDTGVVKPCGNYPNGETQDYTVNFIALSNDVGVAAILHPLPGDCQADSQRVTIQLKNTGSTDQMNFPIHLKVLSGNSTLVDVQTIFPDTVIAFGSSVYTFQPPFNTTAGSTYIIQAGTSLPDDQNPTNDAITDTIPVSSGSSKVSGEAEICNSSEAGLRANTTDSSDAVFWFSSATATSPIATGNPANTTVIPADKTYYLGLNEIAGSVGPPNKMVFTQGGYNFFQGNFVKIHNDVPVTISTARLYVGAPGKVDFIIADLADYDSCTGAYDYFIDAENVIDVYPTTPNISRTPSNVNSPLDTGAVFYLGLPVTTPGDHVLIAIAEDSAFLFRNNNIRINPYPIGIPGVFQITGNSAIDVNNCKDTTFDQAYYYFFYDMKITLDKCASPRVPVVAKIPTPAIITLVGNSLSSNYPSGNQWYYMDTLIAGKEGTQDTLSIRGPGTYKDIVNDSVGCSLVSNIITYSPGNDIGLKVAPNPNNGVFSVKFFQNTVANVGLRVLDITGQLLYESNTPNFKGSFNKSINLGVVSGGMYIVQLEIGNAKYDTKIMVY